MTFIKKNKYTSAVSASIFFMFDIKDSLYYTICMTYVTGDTHAFLDERSNFFNLLSSKDILIVLGDFGFSFNENCEKVWNDKNYPFTTLSVLGNHENYKKIYESYPVVDVFGGKAYQFNSNTFYAKNGEMFKIGKEKFFIFGGANSIDKEWRIPYKSWWPEEIPTMSDYNHAIETLKKNKWKFDYFLTHTGSEEEIRNMFGISDPIKDPTEGMISQFMSEIKNNNGKFKTHFFGHMHELSESFNDNFDSICLFKEIYSLKNNEIITISC